MKTDLFVEIAKNLPPHIAVLMRGPTGIGKSSLARLVSLDIELPMVDVRGSTSTEGDVQGFPDIEGMKKNGVMTFCMPSWFVRACNEPVLLFLDELNRSLPAVQQSFFQIVLDRQLGNDENGNPYSLHPETRVYAAVNHGNEYDVNDMDPALLRRFYVADIENESSNWLNWARDNNIDNLICEYIKKHPHNLRVDPSSVDPGTVIPCNSQWHRIDEVLKHNSMKLIEEVGKANMNLYNICLGFVGKEAAIEFTDFIKNYKISVSAEDILNSYDKVKETLKETSNDRINSLIDQLGSLSKESDWSYNQGKNVAEFGKNISQEMALHLWSVITSNKNIESIKSLHKHYGDYIVEIVEQNKEL